MAIRNRSVEVIVDCILDESKCINNVAFSGRVWTNKHNESAEIYFKFLDALEMLNLKICDHSRH